MKEQPTLEKKYTITEKISQGSYGVVYKGKNTQTGEVVAIKKFKSITNEGIPVSCVRQLHILNLLNTTKPQQHPQLTLKLYDVYQQKTDILMVVQWLDQTLASVIQSSQPYDTRKLFSDILKSVLQLHQHFIIHRDIKPMNIMLSHATDQMKVLDYGMAKEVEFDDRPMTNEVGSLYYRAPELLVGARRYDFGVDVWALGCVFYEMLAKRVLFKAESQLEQVKKIFKVTGSPQVGNQAFAELMKKVNIETYEQDWSQIKAQLPHQAFDLLKSMLALDPKLRPSVSEILSHPYFS